MVGNVGFDGVGMVGIEENLGFGNEDKGGTGSIGFGNWGKGWYVGFGSVSNEGKGGNVSFGNVSNESKGGSVGLDNVCMIGKVWVVDWEDCKIWQVVKLTSMLKMDIAMDKAMMKHLEDVITIGVLLCVTRL